VPRLPLELKCFPTTGRFPVLGRLIEEKCIGANFEKHREFCRTHGLALSKYGHAVVWQKEWYQVFRFAEQAHAESFMFGGERMNPAEKGRGQHWMKWHKGTYKEKPRNPHDFSKD
jgi:hypothetical protein